MPYNNYSRMAKDDLYAIIAYLRTLAPSDSTVPAEATRNSTICVTSFTGICARKKYSPGFIG